MRRCPRGGTPSHCPGVGRCPRRRRRLQCIVCPWPGAMRIVPGPSHLCFHPRRGPMRGVAAFVLSLSFTLVGGLALSPALSATADAPDLSGDWKLIALPYGDDEFLIFDVKAADGKLSGTVTSAQADARVAQDGRGHRRGGSGGDHLPRAGRTAEIPRRPGQGRQGPRHGPVPRHELPGPDREDRGQGGGQARTLSRAEEAGRGPGDDRRQGADRQDSRGDPGVPRPPGERHGLRPDSRLGRGRRARARGGPRAHPGVGRRGQALRPRVVGRRPVPRPQGAPGQEGLCRAGHRAGPGRGQGVDGRRLARRARRRS